MKHTPLSPAERAAVPSGTMTPRQRALSLAEFALGGAVVVAHNVFDVLPNEVYVLVVFGLVSLRWRDGSWAALGLSRPASWGRTAVIAVSAALARLLLSGLLVDPLTAHFWPSAAADTHGFGEITGSPSVAFRWLLTVWTLAAFGEEVSYRGYLLNRAADVGNRSQGAYWLGLLAVSVLFGVGHYYKGPGGMIDSGAGGFVFGAAYLLSGRNLWVSVLAHGLVDSVGILVLFLGLA